MADPISVQELPRYISDFSVLISWSEQVDRPLHNALLVSASQATFIDETPHWSYGVISPEELNRLLDVLAANVYTFYNGLYVSDESEFFVEIELGKQMYNCGLGFNQWTIDVVTLMADAIEMDNQPPLREIIANLQPMIDNES